MQILRSGHVARSDAGTWFSLFATKTWCGARIDQHADNAISESKIAGLLEMERSGRNRTEHVQVLCKRLGVKSPTEVTDAGPAYTNDTTQTNKLI